MSSPACLADTTNFNLIAQAFRSYIHHLVPSIFDLLVPGPPTHFLPAFCTHKQFPQEVTGNVWGPYFVTGVGLLSATSEDGRLAVAYIHFYIG